MPVKNRNMVTAPKKRLVGKQPHLLAYITPAEAALLKKNGGTGEMVDGIPAFRKSQGRPTENLCSDWIFWWHLVHKSSRQGVWH
jgi:hypothetical protein